MAAKTLTPRKSFFDLVMVAVGVGAEAREVGAEALLHRVEPRLPRIVAGVDAAGLEQVVVDLFEDQRVEVPSRLVPVGCLAGLEPDELDREPCSLGAREH